MTFRRHLGAIGTSACAILLLPGLARACSYATPLIKGASSFKVTVVDYRERPVPGAAIVLWSGDKEVARFKSDAHGEALTGMLAQGRYELSLDQDVVAFFAQGYGLEVAKESKDVKELVFHWPAQDVIATSTLSGSLHYWETAPGGNGLETLLKRSRGEGTTHALPKVQLSLFKFNSNEKVGETSTDGEGRFDFRVVETGLYYMRFKFESYEETVLLDLDPSFAHSAPFIDVLIEDFIICGNAPHYRSLWPAPFQNNPRELQP
jgi:5-hydroxyisourate hydrolase-like protein (transthyretin family)